MKKYFAVLFVFLLAFGLVYGIPMGLPSPSDEIKKLLPELVETPSTLMTIEESFIDFPRNPISTESLAERLPLSSDQFCLSLGEFRDSSEWVELVPGQEIRYVGEGYSAVKFSALCEKGLNLESAIQRVGGNKINLSDIENCGCVGKNETCCVVVLTDSRPGGPFGSLPESYITMLWIPALLGLLSYPLFFLGISFIIYGYLKRKRKLKILGLYLVPLAILLYMLFLFLA